MNFSDIFRKSFLEGYAAAEITTRTTIVLLTVTTLFAAYIFFAYRIFSRKTFYDKSFNAALALITVIVAGIILTIQSSLVVSLGMVGALSIVRFRTAIENPLDLVFIFWSIAVGIICGSGQAAIAVVMSVIITVGLIVMELLPVAKAPVLLIVHADDASVRAGVLSSVKANTNAFSIKSQTMEKNRLNMILEIRIKDDEKLIQEISSLSGVTRCSIVSHDGEVTF